jgi:hypothetical protein
MKSKSTTQKLNIRWQDRSWKPRIESHEDNDQAPADLVAIYQTAGRADAADVRLVVRHRRVVQRTVPPFRKNWNN